jgi:hypothetical protein
MNRFFSISIIGLVLLFILPKLSDCGEIYRWVDENGVVHFSDSPTDSSVFKEDNTQTMIEYEADESAPNAKEGSTNRNMANKEEQRTITEASTEIYQSMIKSEKPKKEKLDYKTNQKQFRDNYSGINRSKTSNGREVQNNPQVLPYNHNKRPYTNKPVVTTNKYNKPNNQNEERNARIAAENKKRHQEYEKKLNEYNKQKKRIEAQNAKIRAENDRRRREYEKKKKEAERHNAKARAHNERVRRLKERNKQKPVQRDFGRKPYLGRDYQEMMYQ